MQTVDTIIDRAAAELVEELLEAGAKGDGSPPWFIIVRRKMHRLREDIKRAEVLYEWKKAK